MVHKRLVDALSVDAIAQGCCAIACAVAVEFLGVELIEQIAEVIDHGFTFVAHTVNDLPYVIVSHDVTFEGLRGLIDVVAFSLGRDYYLLNFFYIVIKTVGNIVE